MVKISLLCAYAILSFSFCLTAAIGGEYVRAVKKKSGEITSLETAVVNYKKDDVVVDLISAIHAADAAYYKKVNEIFTKYQFVLYEFLSEEEFLPTKVAYNPSLYSRVLSLSDQRSEVNYKAPNMVHADLSPEEILELMENRGDTEQTLALEQLAASIRYNNLNPKQEAANDLDVITMLFMPHPEKLIKQDMAAEFDREDETLYSPAVYKLCILDRNNKCVHELDRLLEGGAKSVGIFYGASHMKDFDILLKRRGFTKESSAWVEAWDLK